MIPSDSHLIRLVRLQRRRRWIAPTEQDTYDINDLMLRMRRNAMTLRAIGAAFECTAETVRKRIGHHEAVLRGQRRRRDNERWDARYVWFTDEGPCFHTPRSLFAPDDGRLLRRLTPVIRQLFPLQPHEENRG